MTGRASVAAIYSVGLSYLPQLQRAVKARHPKAEVRYQFAHPDEVYRLVEQGLVDFGLVSYPQSSKTVIGHGLAGRDDAVGCAARSPLATAGEIAPVDLSGEWLVAFAPNLRIRHEIDRYLRQLGITMQVAAEFDNIDSVKHAMEVNSAVAFLPETTVCEEIAEWGARCTSLPLAGDDPTVGIDPAPQRYLGPNGPRRHGIDPFWLFWKDADRQDPQHDSDQPAEHSQAREAELNQGDSKPADTASSASKALR